MTEVIFQGQEGVLQLEELARTEDTLKFVIRGVVAIRVKGEFINGAMLSEETDKLIKREAVIKLKKLIEEINTREDKNV